MRISAVSHAHAETAIMQLIVINFASTTRSNVNMTEIVGHLAKPKHLVLLPMKANPSGYNIYTS
jgi:hypothetical protein